MCDVNVRHQKIIVTDDCLRTFFRSGIHRYIFADFIAVPDSKIRNATIKFFILRQTTDDRARKKLVVLTNGRMAFNGDTRPHYSSITNSYIRLNNRKRPNLNAFTQLGIRVNESTIRRLPIEIRLFEPFGGMARIKATYISQNGRFANSAKRAILSGNDDFWVVDASLGYRLPRRLGIVSIEVRNLFGTRFSFQDSEADNSPVARARVMLGKLVMEF